MSDITRQRCDYTCRCLKNACFQGKKKPKRETDLVWCRIIDVMLCVSKGCQKKRLPRLHLSFSLPCKTHSVGPGRRSVGSAQPCLAPSQFRRRCGVSNHISIFLTYLFLVTFLGWRSVCNALCFSDLPKQTKENVQLCLCQMFSCFFMKANLICNVY